MRMVNVFLNRFVRACPKRFLRLRHHGPLDSRPRGALSRASVFSLAPHQNITTSASTIDTDCSIADVFRASEELRGPENPDPEAPALQALLPDNPDYGKWNFLYLDQQRLGLEADVSNTGSTQLLVDRPENSDDAHLWLCILVYRMQREGLSGAAAIMEGLLARGSLITVKGGPARVFWKTILDVAPSSNDMMKSVWAYGEWLYDRHDVRWPELYMSLISSLIRNRRWNTTLKWHLRLAPKFGPNAESLAILLKRFISYKQPSSQVVLKTIYLTSYHPQMYDEIIPYLSARSLAAMAREWRRLFIARGDLPRSSASRSFIRFLFEYCPDDHLDERELDVAGLGSKAEFSTLELKRSIDLEPPVNVYDLFNSTAGERQLPGLPESAYNDKTAARFLASSWVSIDFGINSLSALGVTNIGPLAFQILALRDKKCERLKQRLEQLKQGGVGIDDSSYSQTLHHAIVTDNDKLLKQLICSDVYPPAFDDLKLERHFLRSRISSGSESHAELTATIRLTASAVVGRTAANELLLVSLRRKNDARTLRILDAMINGRFEPFETTVQAISSQIVQTMSPSRRHQPVDSRFYAVVFSMMLYFDLAPTSAALRIILAHLIQDGRFPEVLYLVSEVIDNFKRRQSSGTASIRVHKTDVPRLARQEGKEDFQCIPTDLEFDSPWHPIQLMLKRSTKEQIIRRGFMSILDPSQFQRYPVNFADGIKLLSQLRDKGIVVDKHWLRDEIIACIAELKDFLVRFCPPHLRRLLRAQGRTSLILRTLTDEVNSAWGSRLLLDSPIVLKRKLYIARINHLLETQRSAVLELERILDSPGSPRSWRFKRQGMIGLLRGVGTREQTLELLRELAAKVGYPEHSSPLIHDLRRGKPNIVWMGGRNTDRLQKLSRGRERQDGPREDSLRGGCLPAGGLRDGLGSDRVGQAGLEEGELEEGASDVDAEDVDLINFDVEAEDKPEEDDWY
ncbi:hypothetical protein QBC34DRAFT_396443 [Podospora aff. communis PSN243]|uniref:Pentatricopeptide repeat domain-containing protein n=1 Tax=Podospora aff. communis PSN243 TaxID=3040156 RepID=A0AAV9GZL5_9PEZI|nr:hypothetical protein QBC34DRAFT_396443 [Podospora aff. communis PSN243]